MSEPVVEQIMQNLRDRIETAFEVYRSTRVATWLPKDQTTHVFQGGLVANEEISCPGNPPAKGWTLQAAVAGIAKPSDRDTTPIDTHKNRLGADIMNAITGVDLWHQFGALAINTDLSEVEDYMADDGSSGGVIVRLAIHFRVSEIDQFTVRA